MSSRRMEPSATALGQMADISAGTSAIRDVTSEARDARPLDHASTRWCRKCSSNPGPPGRHIPSYWYSQDDQLKPHRRR